MSIGRNGGIEKKMFGEETRASLYVYNITNDRIGVRRCKGRLCFESGGP